MRSMRSTHPSLSSSSLSSTSRSNTNSQNTNIHSQSSPFTPVPLPPSDSQNYSTENHSTAFQSSGHFDRTPNHPHNPSEIKIFADLSIRNGLRARSSLSITYNLDRGDVPTSLVLPITKPSPRETARAFDLPEDGDVTIFIMPPELTEYEKILIKRGFTVHSECHVDWYMRRALRIFKYKTPLAIFSNYEGKSADWFIENKKKRFWFFSFINDDGHIIEYAEPVPEKIFVWYQGIELAAWMAGTMGPKKGILICP